MAKSKTGLGQAPENQERTNEWQSVKNKPIPTQKIEDTEETKKWETDKKKKKK
jgi:hypothetical protein